MNIKIKISTLFLGIAAIFLLIGLIAGNVIATSYVNIDFIIYYKFSDAVIAISFLIPWLFAVIFGMGYYFQLIIEKQLKEK